jgi:hypothetical protein
MIEPFDLLNNMESRKCNLLTEEEVILCAQDDMHNWLFHCDELPTAKDLYEKCAHLSQVYCDNHTNNPGEHEMRDYLSEYASDYINSMRKANPNINNEENPL